MNKFKHKEPKDLKDQAHYVMYRPNTYITMSETEPSQAFKMPLNRDKKKPMNIKKAIGNK